LDINLYSTSACHLCEQAEELIEKTFLPGALRLHKVDIVEEESLVEEYGVRIPVLKRLDTGEELGWPFDREDLINFCGLS